MKRGGEPNKFNARGEHINRTKTIWHKPLAAEDQQVYAYRQMALGENF